MIELIIGLVFMMIMIGFVAFGEWLNNKFNWIDVTDSDYQDHLERQDKEHDKYYVRKQS